MYSRVNVDYVIRVATSVYFISNDEKGCLI